MQLLIEFNVEPPDRLIAAAVDLATTWQLDDLAWQLACAFQPYYDLRNHRDDWIHTHERALAAARRAGSPLGEATVLPNLGQLRVYQDDYATSASTMATSLELFRQAGDRLGAAYALAGLGTAERMQGRATDALSRYAEALDLFRSVADPHGEAAMLMSIGSTWMVQGQDDAAERHFAHAGTLASHIGDTHREARQPPASRAARDHDQRHQLEYRTRRRPGASNRRSPPATTTANELHGVVTCPRLGPPPPAFHAGGVCSCGAAYRLTCNDFNPLSNRDRQVIASRYWTP